MLRCKRPKRGKKKEVGAVMAQAAFIGRALPRQLRFKAALQLIRMFKARLRYLTGKADVASDLSCIQAWLDYARLIDWGESSACVFKGRSRRYAFQSGPIT